MRTAYPQNIKKDFLAGLKDIEDTFTKINNTQLTATSKQLMAEYTFLGAAIFLEGFISDLFIAYISKNNTEFVKHLTKNMSIATQDEFAGRAVKLATIDILAHLKLDQIRSVLDPRDYNISFENTDQLKEKAGRWLSQPYKNYFLTLTPKNCAVIEATKGVRNFLAHRSGAAKKAMQKNLMDQRLPKNLRRAKNNVRKVGSFLESKPSFKGDTRLNLYMKELKEIAQHLCP